VILTVGEAIENIMATAKFRLCCRYFFIFFFILLVKPKKNNDYAKF